jgi:hypothetical protein
VTPKSLAGAAHRARYPAVPRHGSGGGQSLTRTHIIRASRPDRASSRPRASVAPLWGSGTGLRSSTPACGAILSYGARRHRRSVLALILSTPSTWHRQAHGAGSSQHLRAISPVHVPRVEAHVRLRRVAHDATELTISVRRADVPSLRPTASGTATPSSCDERKARAGPGHLPRTANLAVVVPVPTHRPPIGASAPVHTDPHPCPALMPRTHVLARIYPYSPVGAGSASAPMWRSKSGRLPSSTQRGGRPASPSFTRLTATMVTVVAYVTDNVGDYSFVWSYLPGRGGNSTRKANPSR